MIVTFQMIVTLATIIAWIGQFDVGKLLLRGDRLLRASHLYEFNHDGKSTFTGVVRASVKSVDWNVKVGLLMDYIFWSATSNAYCTLYFFR